MTNQTSTTNHYTILFNPLSNHSIKPFNLTTNNASPAANNLKLSSSSAQQYQKKLAYKVKSALAAMK